jgi:hypothetical protein
MKLRLAVGGTAVAAVTAAAVLVPGGCRAGEGVLLAGRDGRRRQLPLTPFVLIV